MKKDKDKLKNDSNLLKDLATGMTKVRTADSKKKSSKEVEKWKGLASLSGEGH